MPFLAIAIVAVISALALQLNGVGTLERFFGDAPPFVAIAVIMLAGRLADGYLRRTQFRIIAPAVSVSTWRVACLALLVFAGAVASADLLWRFPADINVPPPWSFVHYPVMAAVAIVVFNLAPLAAGSWAVRALAASAGKAALRMIAVLAALIEPALQTYWAMSRGPELIAFTFIQVFAFNLVSTWIYARAGVGSLFLLRLGYYAFWHIAWSAFRAA